MALVTKIVIFIVVYGGIHVSVTSLNMVIEFLTIHYIETSLEILLGILAIIFAFGSTVASHFLTKRGTNGWRLLATITPLLAAFGGVLVEYTPFGGVLVAAFVPALLYLVHPAKTDSWTRSILGIEDGGRIAVVLGASAAMLLLIEDKMAFTPCLITFMVLVIALIVTGAWLGYVSIINKNKEREQLEARSIADVRPIVAVSAYLSLISWGLMPLIVMLVLKEFSALASYGSSLDPVSVGWLTLISLTAGVAVAAIVMIVARGKVLFHYLVIAMLCILGTCLAIVLLVTGLDGNTIVTLRMIVMVTLPFMFVAMLAIPVPDVKGIAFHFWKGLLAIGGLLLLIFGIGFNIKNGESIYVTIYFIMIGFAVASTIVNGFSVKNYEVTNQ